jgi:predicted RNase H-like HicB family nuclease
VKNIKMNTKEFIYWEDKNMWLGYLKEYPDYLTQGETLEELKDNLIDIFTDLVSGVIPNARRTGELEIA